jgi:hypothetical protein
MTRSEMHLMHRPLEFAQSVSDFVGNIDPQTTYRRNWIHRQHSRWLWHFKQLFSNSLWNADGDYSVGMNVSNCGIWSNYFQTLCEMPTDLISSVWSSVIVAFHLNSLWNADGCYSVGNCGIVQEILSLYCLFTFLQTLKW